MERHLCPHIAEPFHKEMCRTHPELEGSEWMFRRAASHRLTGLNQFLIIKHQRRNEAAEFALDQFGQFERRAIFQPGADDLHADRQAFR